MKFEEFMKNITVTITIAEGSSQHYCQIIVNLTDYLQSSMLRILQHYASKVLKITFEDANLQ